MTLTELIQSQMAFADFVTTRGVKNLSDEHLRTRPEGCGNPGIWILGHIAYSRSNYLYHARGDENRLPDGWHDFFARGTAIPDDLSIFPPVTDIKEFLKAEQQAALDYLTSLSEAQLLAAPAIPLFNLKTVADVYSSLALHETYHAGQFALICKMTGKKTIK